jgi:hypothetical protein
MLLTCKEGKLVRDKILLLVISWSTVNKMSYSNPGLPDYVETECYQLYCIPKIIFAVNVCSVTFLYLYDYEVLPICL